jgi:hypothetical protein
MQRQGARYFRRKPEQRADRGMVVEASFAVVQVLVSLAILLLNCW